MGTSKTSKQPQLVSAIADLNEELVLKLVRESLSAGEDPLNVVTKCQEGLNQVGERYAQRKYYLSGLIMGGEIFYEAMELVKPLMESRVSGNSSGKVLLGTVAGDIHDLGKNIVKLLLVCHKVTVYDLGTDVAPAEFLSKAEELQPNVLGLSGLITRAFDSMRDTVRLFHQKRVKIPIIIGGGQLNEEVFRYTGADYWVNDASLGVQLSLRLLKKAVKKD